MDRNGKKEFERSTWTRWNGDFFGAFCCNKSNAHLEEYLWNYFVEKILDIRWQEKSTRCMSCIQSIRLHKGFIYIYISLFYTKNTYVSSVWPPGWRGPIPFWDSRLKRNWKLKCKILQMKIWSWSCKCCKQGLVTIDHINLQRSVFFLRGKMATFKRGIWEL